jgi:hypothetical protein
MRARDSADVIVSFEHGDWMDGWSREGKKTYRCAKNLRGKRSYFGI